MSASKPEDDASKSALDSKKDSADAQESDDAAPTARRKDKAEATLSPDEIRARLHAELFGDDFEPDERFQAAIDKARVDIRQRKIAAT